MAEFDWEEFLSLAEELILRQGNPGAERTAISRAYYAAFHKAFEHVVRQGGRVTYTGRDHALIWDWFLRPDGSRQERWIGDVGLRLRRSRRHADYDATPIARQSAEALKSVINARRVIRSLTDVG